MNSVDKTPEGDYIVSSRHSNTIYHLCGQNGSVNWQLGGKHSSFALSNFNFSSQHDARLFSKTDESTTITFFNNGADTSVSNALQSSGMLVRLDHGSMTATVETRFFAPDGGLLTRSQGNVQHLPNGNFLVGWGENAYISEHYADGTCIYFANMGTDSTSNYRAFKFPWMGAPLDEPTLSVTTSSKTPVSEFHMS